jgi:formyl-CoA transferase
VAGALRTVTERGKRSVAIDLSTVAGRAALLDVARRADVFVHSLRPVELTELGLADALAGPDFDDVVTVSITGFGAVGPYRNHAWSDLVCCAAGNISFGIGAKDGPPLKLPLSLAGYEAGATAFLAAMAALCGRPAEAGVPAGADIDVAVTDVLAGMFSTGVTAFPYRGVSGRRNGNHGIALYPDVFLPCRDGYIGLVCNQLPQWLRFLDLTGNPAWTEQPRYRDRRRMTEEYPEEVDAFLVPWLAEHTREEIFQLCRERHVPVAPAYTVGELLANQHLLDRAAFTDVEVADRTVRVPAPPFVFSTILPQRWVRAPRTGEDTFDVLTGIAGMTTDRVASLYASGAVA